MGQLSLGDLNFFFFVIPGFVIVWSFRYFTRSKKTGDFEYLGLSLVWGLGLVIALEGWISGDIQAGKFYKGPGKHCSYCDFLPVCLGDKMKAEETLVRIG